MSNQPYTIVVRGERITVSETVYRAYYQHREHARYLHQQSMRHELSWQRLEDAGMPVDYHLRQEVSPFEPKYAALYEALKLLSPEEEEMLWQLVMGEATERDLALRQGVSKTTIHKRKCKVLKILRESMEKTLH